MKARNRIDIEPWSYSLSAYENLKIVIHLFRHSQKVQREDYGAIQLWRMKENLQSLHKFFIGLTIDGKHAWQQEEERKGDISIALMFQEQSFISELFKDIQDAIFLIFHFRTML